MERLASLSYLVPLGSNNEVRGVSGVTHSERFQKTGPYCSSVDEESLGQETNRPVWVWVFIGSLLAITPVSWFFFTLEHGLHDGWLMAKTLGWIIAIPVGLLYWLTAGLGEE